MKQFLTTVPASRLKATVAPAALLVALLASACGTTTDNSNVPADIVVAQDIVQVDIMDVAAETDAEATDIAEQADTLATSDLRDTDKSKEEITAIDATVDPTQDIGPKPDVPPYVPPHKPPEKCIADTDCQGYGACQPGTCDQTSGKCSIAPLTDGATCEIGGTCGNKGICKQGSCIASNACSASQCSPVALKCGDVLVVDLTAVSASSLNQYPFADDAYFGGPEKAFALSDAVTQTAEVSISEDGKVGADIIVMGQATPGVCNPLLTYSYGDSVTLGLQPGIKHLLVVDTKPGTGAFTLTVTCKDPSVTCGNGTCESGETCQTCKKDCGACGTCGNNTCEYGENCESCTQDCGTCAPECTPKSSGTPGAPGCGGCGCEKCVCDDDPYCCSTAWDSSCVSQCNDCGGNCPSPNYCGDGDCSYDEGDTPEDCPNDCTPYSFCGDGLCDTDDYEDCEYCPEDCGFCGEEVVAESCGNGTCSAEWGESCGTCTQDCGKCDDCSIYVAKTGPGCPGCACEAAVCSDDPYCCNNKWDATCAEACAEVSGAKCPESQCGDGQCTIGEDCGSCSNDCGECVCGNKKCEGYEIYDCEEDCAGECGDFSCDDAESCSSCPNDCGPCTCGDDFCAKGESSTECPWDCKHICDTYCGGSTPAGCYCDDMCTEFGDCCDATGADNGDNYSCAGSSCAECN